MNSQTDYPRTTFCRSIKMISCNVNKGNNTAEERKKLNETVAQPFPVRLAPYFPPFPQGVGPVRSIGDLPFFRPFSVDFPIQLSARVTAKLVNGVYLMRDTTILSSLYEYVVRPHRHLLPTLFTGDDAVPCIARVVRPKPSNKKRPRSRLYRGTVSNYCLKSKLCILSLVDYGQRMLCDARNIYDISEQPPTVRYLPTASFKFCISKNPAQRSGGRYLKELEVDAEYILCIEDKVEDTFVGSVFVASNAFRSSRKNGHNTKAKKERKVDIDSEYRNEHKNEDRGTGLKLASAKEKQELFSFQKSLLELEIDVMALQLEFARVLHRMNAFA